MAFGLNLKKPKKPKAMRAPGGLRMKLGGKTQPAAQMQQRKPAQRKRGKRGQ
jgi:hypothetical protein